MSNLRGVSSQMVNLENQDDILKKRQDDQKKRLFLAMMPKVFLGAMIGVIVVVIASSQIFRTPKVEFENLYVIENELFYDINIDPLDSSIDEESLIIRLEANREKEDTVATLGYQSGSFSISQNRNYKISVWGDIGLGLQLFAEKKIKAEAIPYIKLDIFEQEGTNLMISFTLLNDNLISDNKITVQVLKQLQTVYMEDYPIQSGYQIQIPNIKPNDSYKLRILANTPKRLTLHESVITTTDRPKVWFFVEDFGPEIFYNFEIFDAFNRITGDILVQLVKENKVIEEIKHNDGMGYQGAFMKDKFPQGDYKILVKTTLGLKLTTIYEQDLFIGPIVSLDYQVGPQITGVVSVNEYLVSEYSIYAALQNLTTNEVQKVLITEDLVFTFDFDILSDHYLWLELERNDKTYKITTTYFINKAELNGEITVQSANTTYNSVNKTYEVTITSNSTYSQIDLTNYRIEIFGDNELLANTSISYQPEMKVPVNDVYETMSFKIYATYLQSEVMLLERSLDNNLLVAKLDFNSILGKNNFQATFFGDSTELQNIGIVYLRVTDKDNQVNMNESNFSNPINNELYVNNYGNTFVEILFNEEPIGAKSFFAHPKGIMEIGSSEGAIITNYFISGVELTNQVFIEQYLDGVLIERIEGPNATFTNVIDGSYYQFKVVLVDGIEYTVYTQYFDYFVPLLQEQVRIRKVRYLYNFYDKIYEIQVDVESTIAVPSTYQIRINSDGNTLYEEVVDLYAGMISIPIDNAYPNISVEIIDLSNNNVLDSKSNIQYDTPYSRVDMSQELDTISYTINTYGINDVYNELILSFTDNGIITQKVVPASTVITGEIIKTPGNHIVEVIANGTIIGSKSLYILPTGSLKPTDDGATLNMNATLDYLVQDPVVVQRLSGAVVEETVPYPGVFNNLTPNTVYTFNLVVTTPNGDQIIATETAALNTMLTTFAHTNNEFVLTWNESFWPDLQTGDYLSFELTVDGVVIANAFPDTQPATTNTLSFAYAQAFTSAYITITRMRPSDSNNIIISKKFIYL